MVRFNVLTEPWITAVDTQGKAMELGILEVLGRAHELSAIADPAPPIQFGLYRLLVTFVQYAFQIVEYEDLEDAFDEGHFDPAVMERYVAEIGENRFDLFDPEHPFLQSQPMEGDEKNPKSVVELFYHLPAGTNVTHFHHSAAADHAVAPAVAARGLCSIAPFMTQGGAGYSPSINGTPPWYVLPKGETLFETILLNTSVWGTKGVARDGSPAWATSEKLVPKAEKGVESCAEGFTWQPRQVRLLFEEGGICTYSGRKTPILVRNIVWGPGYKFNQYDGWYDPNVAYFHDKRRGKLPLRPQPERQLWRDYDALFLMKDPSKKTRPIIIDQLDYIKQDDLIPQNRVEYIEVYGMRVQQAKVFEWFYDALPVSQGVLANPGAAAQVEHALELAEYVAAALRQALKELHPRGGKGNRTALNNVIAYAQSEFWSDMEIFFETEYLPTLADQAADDEEGREKLLAAWKKQLQAAGWARLWQAIEGIGTDADSLIRQVDAENAFARRIGSKLSTKHAS